MTNINRSCVYNQPFSINYRTVASLVFFCFFLQVYCKKNSKDGLVDIKDYIIEDIDGLDTDNLEEKNILRIIHELGPSKAVYLANIEPVAEVIRGKWRAYRAFFYMWWILQFMFTCCLICSGIFRAELPYNGTIDERPAFEHKIFEHVLVTFYASLSLVVSVIYIALEFCRIKNGLMPWNIKSFGNPYGNSIFRVLFILLSLCLIGDFIAASVSDLYENYLLICAIVIACFLQLFFLRSWNRCSFFTVLISKVFVNDMFPFFIMLILEVVAFGTALYMAFQGSEMETEDGVSNYWRVLYSLAHLMVGIGDPPNLFNTRHPILVALIFIAFVVMTTLLIVNALIAMMSDTTTKLGDHTQDEYCCLQRLALILYIESTCCFRYIHFTGNSDSSRNIVHPEKPPERTLRITSKRKLTSPDTDDLVDKESIRKFENEKHDRCELDYYPLPSGFFMEQNSRN